MTIDDGAESTSRSQSDESGLDGFESWGSEPGEEVREYVERAQAHRQGSVTMLHDANQKRLETIFADNFHPDDPPESYQLLKDEVAVRNLAWTVKTAVGGVTTYTAPSDENPRSFAHDTGKMPVGSGRRPVDRVAKVEDEGYGEGEEQIALDAISQMSTYGDVAEPHLSELSSSPNLEPKFKQAALDELKKLRREPERPPTLAAAVSQWLAGLKR